jgi:hypothetical protein
MNRGCLPESCFAPDIAPFHPVHHAGQNGVTTAIGDGRFTAFRTNFSKPRTTSLISGADGATDMEGGYVCGARARHLIED